MTALTQGIELDGGIAAGSTDQDRARVKAIDFYLCCCNDPRFGPGKLCCENWEQWSNYFDWIYPCFKNQRWRTATKEDGDSNGHKLLQMG